MGYHLKDGETRKMRGFQFNEIEVIAERVDCDTPVVHLKIGNEHVALADVDAHELVKMINRALSILPTSK